MNEETYTKAAAGVETARATWSAAVIAWREGGWPQSGPLKKALDKSDAALKKASEATAIAAGDTLPVHKAPGVREKELKEWEAQQGRGK